MSKHGRYWGLSQKRRALEEELDEQRAYNLHAAKIIKPKELEAGQFKCGGKFVLRQNKKNKEYFYGCTNYLKCTETKSIVLPSNFSFL